VEWPFLNRYSRDGRYIVSRDYLSVKIWDVNMENKPVKTIALHDYLRPMLYDLFTSDIIFDKFEICCSPDGKKFASGSYRLVLNFLVWVYFSPMCFSAL
jgi:serine/threonine-protein phosphatase 2A regulatory subunit B